MAQENHRSSSNSIECKQIYERQWKVCKIENNKVNSNIRIRSEISGKDENTNCCGFLNLNLPQNEFLGNSLKTEKNHNRFSSQNIATSS